MQILENISLLVVRAIKSVKWQRQINKPTSSAQDFVLDLFLGRKMSLESDDLQMFSVKCRAD